VLVGVVTRARLRKVLAQDAKEPMDRCRYLCCGIVDNKGERFYRPSPDPNQSEQLLDLEDTEEYLDYDSDHSSASSHNHT